MNSQFHWIVPTGHMEPPSLQIETLSQGLYRRHAIGRCHQPLDFAGAAPYDAGVPEYAK